MNMWAWVEIQKEVAEAVGVPVGVYRHFADSFHIYGKDWKQFEGFTKLCNSRSAKERTFVTAEVKNILIETNEKTLVNEKSTLSAKAVAGITKRICQLEKL